MENKYPLVGKKVRELRLKQSLTQEQLAESIDITQNFLSNIERGKGFPSLETIIKLANAFSVGTDTLLADYIDVKNIDTNNIADYDLVMASLSKMTAEQQASAAEILCILSGIA